MAMQVGDKSNDDMMVDMNMTPLIDVMLVLLIMFIITIPIQNHHISLNNPQNSVSKNDKITQPVIVEVNVNGQMNWNGEIIKDDDELDMRLLQSRQADNPVQIYIKPAIGTIYQHVAHVLAAAQRLNIQNIAVVGNERFLN